MALSDFFKKLNPLKVGAPLKPMGKFPLVDAHDVIVEVLNYGEPTQKEVRLDEKLQGLAPDDGSAGVGIDRIQYLSTSADGLVDTYSIVLTNGDTHEFTVRNGKDGDTPDKAEIINEVLDRLPIAEEVSV